MIWGENPPFKETPTVTLHLSDRETWHVGAPRPSDFHDLEGQQMKMFHRKEFIVYHLFCGLSKDQRKQYVYIVNLV